MEPSDLKGWLNAMGLSARKAAIQLGCSRSAMNRWAQGKSRIPLYIALACSALAKSLQPWKDNAR